MKGNQKLLGGLIGLVLIVRFAFFCGSLTKLEKVLRKNSGGDARVAVSAVWQAANRRSDFVPETADESVYDNLGLNLSHGKGFVYDDVFLIGNAGKPTAFLGCLYPLFLGTMYKLTGGPNQLPVYLLQILLQALSVALIFMMALPPGGRKGAVVASLYFIFHPSLIWSSNTLMPEGLTIPLTAFLLHLLTLAARGTQNPRWNRFGVPALAGLVMAALALTHQSFAYFIPPGAALVAWGVKNAGGARSFGVRLALCVCAATVVLTPWTIYNYHQFHRFYPFGTKAGFNAWTRNNPSLKLELSIRAVDGNPSVDAFSPEIRALPDEPARNDRFLELFREFVKSEPGHFLGLIVVHFLLAILPLPLVAGGSFAHLAAWYAKVVPVFALAILLRRDRRAIYGSLLPFFGFGAYWLAMQSLGNPGLRHRVPLDVAMCVVVGVGATLARRVAAR